MEVPRHFDLFSYLTRGSPAFGAAPPSSAAKPGKPRTPKAAAKPVARYDLRVAALVAQVKRLREENAALRKVLARRGGAARQSAGRRSGPMPRPAAAGARETTAEVSAPAASAVIDAEVVEVETGDDGGQVAEVIEFPSGDPWGGDDGDSPF